MHAVIMLTPYNFHHLLERNNHALNQWVYINSKQTRQNLLVKVYYDTIKVLIN